MANEINPETRARLQAFVESDKFNQIKPETQQRLTSLLGTQPNRFQQLIGGVQRGLTSPETRPLQPIGPQDVATNPLGTIPTLALSAAGIAPEDAAPTVGGLVGGLVGQTTGVPGARALGATAGATGGQTVRQLAKVARGEQEKPDFGVIGGDALMTGLIEGLTGVGGRFMFGAARAARTVSQGTKLSKFLGTAGQKVADATKKLTELGKKDPNFVVPKEQVIEIIKKSIENIDDLSGPQVKFLRRWRDIITFENQTSINAKTLVQMEKAFGANANFVPANEVANPAANQAIKEIRKGVSSIVDDLASKAGFPNFAKDSVTVSKALRRLQNKQAGLRVSPTSAGFLGARVGGAPGAILAGGGTAIAESGGIRNFLSTLLEPTGVARGATLTATELGRKLIESLRRNDG